MAKSNDDLAGWFNALGTWLIALCLIYSLLRAEKALYDMNQAAKRMQAEIENGIKGLPVGKVK